MLIRIPNLLDAERLAQARAVLATATWEDGSGSAGPQARTVKNNQQLAPRGPAARELQAIVLDALQRNPLFFSAALPKKIFPPMFNRYGGEANAYGNHVDGAVRYGDHGERIRGDMSCTVFLADPADYDGGDLVIADTLADQRVKWPAGDAVLYPATTVHRVEPVTRGERVASFFWIESMVRSTEQRRMLFDMDLALIRLRERHGESAETVSLTGTYHNLLRLWADT